MNKTKIEWAEASWNPITGCSKISPGCNHCYAERMSRRLAGRYGYPKDEPFRVTFHSDRLDQPYRWKKPRKIFICSMGDLFHGDVPYKTFEKIMFVAGDTSQHTFLILTKRPERMKKYISRFNNSWLAFQKPLKNLWVGVTAENQEAFNKRVVSLLQTPAHIRFISVEPMLSEIDINLSQFPLVDLVPKKSMTEKYLHWTICGTESGAKRRPSEAEWIRKLKNQCVNMGIPFFLKQMEINGKVVKMPELDGKVWNQYPKKTL